MNKLLFMSLQNYFITRRIYVVYFCLNAFISATFCECYAQHKTPFTCSHIVALITRILIYYNDNLNKLLSLLFI